MISEKKDSVDIYVDMTMISILIMLQIIIKIYLIWILQKK